MKHDNGGGGLDRPNVLLVPYVRFSGREFIR